MKKQHTELELRMSKGILESLSSLYPLQNFEEEAINIAVQMLDKAERKTEESFITDCTLEKHMLDEEYLVRDFGSKSRKRI